RDFHVTGVQTCALPIFVLPKVAEELFVARLAVLFRSPPKKSLAGRHARRFDDALVGAPRLDKSDVSVIQDLHSPKSLPIGVRGRRIFVTSSGSRTPRFGATRTAL